MTSLVDICHAVTNDLQADGQTVLGLRDYVVKGPQKALQALVVELLSRTGPVAREATPFLDILGSNISRDKATVNNYFVLFIGEALRSIDDPTRPDNERIASAELLDLFILSADKVAVTIAVTSLAGETFRYEVPVGI